MSLGTTSVILDGQGVPVPDEQCQEPEQMAACFLREQDASMEVATDGSCTKPPIKEFQRAGWSL
eukprot:4651051-Pyramimonas_sp.AAC.1